MFFNVIIPLCQSYELIQILGFHIPTKQINNIIHLHTLFIPIVYLTIAIYPPMKPVSIDLNKANGADAQYQFNRTGSLFGACPFYFSLSVGSSRCLPCHHYRPLVLVTIILATIVSGVLLVTVLLVFNMTVADGSFYLLC